MAQAENMEQVYGVIKNSWYKCQDIEGLMEHGLGNGAKELTDKIYELTSRKEPYTDWSQYKALSLLPSLTLTEHFPNGSHIWKDRYPPPGQCLPWGR